MRKHKKLPVALTIAGSDSGGGAGIQADLKTFGALGVHGTCAITCVTAQNPKGVIGIQACQAAMVRQQIEAVFGELHPAAVKTGMLLSKEIIEMVIDFFGQKGRPPLIVDPVMVATSGACLLRQGAIKTLQDRLLPLATLVTPNLDETEIFTDIKIRAPEDLRTAARRLRSRYSCAVLVKGGHLQGDEAIDIFFDGRTELMLRAPFVRGISTHGTGCTYSAAITAYVARGFKLPRAVELAKVFVTEAIANSCTVNRHWVLNQGYALQPPKFQS
ncbi:MAG: bifunctional hydroxymethylpyrimidine kinase/phosphomethylpyrimidine kinase [Verrucomicrobia bacterium]|nr:bifunctional hydroxymethylpyrimidine kinase/phosphomethylpyrimidine kinase [Verrucomicrobiota bacterium]